MEERELKIFEALENMTMSTKLGERAPRSDHEYMRLLQEGEEEADMDKIYQFVHACERGPGLLHDEVVVNALESGFKISPERLMMILINKRQVERCVFLSGCSRQMKETFITLGAGGDMWFLYECMRQLLDHLQEEVFDSDFSQGRENSIETLVRGAVLLAQGSMELWIRWIREKEYHKVWTDILGDLISGLPPEALMVYSETIQIHRSVQDYAAVSGGLRTMEDKDWERLFRISGQILYDRWTESLDKIRSEKKFQDGLVLTAYGDLTYGALNYLCDTEERWEQELSKEIDRLNDDMTAWYQKSTHMAAVFFADVTQIYLLLNVRIVNHYVPSEFLKEKLLKTKHLLNRLEYLWNGRHLEQRKDLYDLISTGVQPDI